MYTYYETIDEHVLVDIYKYEEQQLSKFKSEFDSLCLNISKLHGWNYTACIQRWTDTTFAMWGNHPFDGYSAMLQVDFTDNIGNLVEIDESVCSFFEYITYVAFHPFKRKYRVFQNEELESIRKEIKQFVCSYEKY